MPLGIERINAKVKQPNDRIIFIKPLDGPGRATAQDYLERVAAIMNPIMKANHLSVTSLEEYEANPEFLGRNFNAGEVIQLVLKSRNGLWLPFRFVQMVMVHELAHCNQMNHSKAFWGLRNAYATELRALWEKGYTGEGMWSRGVLLHDGNFVDQTATSDTNIPEHLCGGTYRSSRKRKRKVKERISYKERQQRRITKKFGVNGNTLGADDEIKSQLENGRRTAAKPRVAGSARGRELRAAAALARFEVEGEVKTENDMDSMSEEEHSSEDVMVKDEPDEAVDLDGTKLLDRQGGPMVRVCEDEDQAGGNATEELSELRKVKSENTCSEAATLAPGKSSDCSSVDNVGQLGLWGRASDMPSRSILNGTPSTSAQQAPKSSASNTRNDAIASRNTVTTLVCSACSMDNEISSFTCVVCANVLDCARSSDVWRCQSKSCEEIGYVNAGDSGLCGACGKKKPSNYSISGLK